MKYVFIRDHRGAFPVDLMYQTLGVGSSGFYAWLKRPERWRSMLFIAGVARPMAVLESMQS